MENKQMGRAEEIIKTIMLRIKRMNIEVQVLNDFEKVLEYYLNNLQGVIIKSKIDFEERQWNNDIKQVFKRYGDEINHVKVNIINGKINNYYDCLPISVCATSGDWQFGDTITRKAIIEHWFSCFHINKYTLILTESWQNNTWRKFKDMITAYENNANKRHIVIVIEYSENGFILRYPLS